MAVDEPAQPSVSGDTHHLPSSLVVMRHGRREDSSNLMWQINARFPWDTPLTVTETEIGDAANRLNAAGRTFDVLYTSPFLRCLETTERTIRALGCENIPVHIHRGLSEVHNPGLLFKSRSPSAFQRSLMWLWRSSYSRHSRAVRERFATKARLVASSKWPQMPESDYQASIRYRAVIMEIAAKHPGQRVLIVSHGNSVQVVHAALGSRGRVQQVAFAGFMAMRPKQQGQEPGQAASGDAAAPGAAGPGARWSAFEPDAEVPWFNVDVQDDANNHHTW